MHILREIGTGVGMRDKHLLRFIRLLTLTIVCTLSTLSAQAQIKFIQLTDPHLYDENAKDYLVENNKNALEAFINETNERKKVGNGYKFVIVTGDIGIEGLVLSLAKKLEEERKAKNEEEAKRIEGQINERITVKANELAGLLARSDIKLWLFLPGNNDLIEENPETIGYYNRFINVLKDSRERKDVSIEDMCPQRPGGQTPKCIAHVEGRYTFVGFNNAAFKNNNQRSLITPDQKKYVDEVESLVEGEAKYAYIFYHIPEIDDPYLASGTPDKKLLEAINERLAARSAKQIHSSDLYSSWFVDSSVRQSWQAVVSMDKVKGLFAGHLHDWRKDTYLNYRWMRSSVYPYQALTKLHICPPLAEKRQEDKPERARGFLEVAIDAAGQDSNQQGDPVVRTVWYEEGPAGGGPKFTDEVRDAEFEAIVQLSLGQDFEAGGRLEEARAAYEKARNSSSVGELANVSLKRLDEERPTMPNFTGWVALIGALCFGIVIGWVTSRTLRRAKPGGLTDIATVIGAVGGAAVTALFRRDTGDFGAYCIGLLIGFFLYLLIAIRMTPPEERKKIGDWLGSEAPVSGGSSAGDNDSDVELPS